MPATKDGQTVEITPIFCTAEINPEIIDDFLERENARFDRTQLGHYICSFFLATKDYKPPSQLEREEGTADIIETTRPVKPFESSVLGETVDEVRQIYKSFYAFRPFTRFSFIIMDERTAQDRTCLLISAQREQRTARCEFGLAAEVLCGVEALNNILNEGIDPDKARDPKDATGILYTEETWPMKADDWKPSHLR